MKSILVISNLYAPVELGGYEILAKQICEELVGRGYRVVVLTTGGEERVQEGVEIWPRLELTKGFDCPDNRSTARRWWIHRRNKRATAQAMAEVGADAALVFSLRRLTLGSAAAIEAASVPRLFVVNDAWPLAYRPRPHSQRLRSRIGGWLDRTILPSLTTLGASLTPAIVLSQSLKNELLEGGLEARRFATVPQGVCTNLFQPMPHKPRGTRVRLLYAGQLHGYKGVHHILEALEKLEKLQPAKSFSLTIAGKGAPDYVRKLQKLTKRLRCSVRFRDHVPFSDMPDLYREHDVLIFPSTWNEPMGLCHLEAMASGIPTIVASAGGCRELIKRCPYIQPYTAGDIHALAKTLQTLVKSRRRRRLIGEASRTWTVKNASLEAYIDRIETELLWPAKQAATETLEVASEPPLRLSLSRDYCVIE